MRPMLSETPKKTTARRSRTPYTGGRRPRYPIDRLMETAGKPRATLAIPLDGLESRKVINALTHAVARRSTTLRFRHYLDDGVLVAWVEGKA